MRKVLVCLALAGLLFGSLPGAAEICTIDDVPAATLLLPYFEVETAVRAQTTLFTVTNVSHLPQVAHVTLWTDYGFPAFAFNLYLTPYDVQPIDLYDVIVNGRMAVGSGPFQTHCADLPATVPEPLRADVRNALTNGVTSVCTGSASAPRIGSNQGAFAVPGTLASGIGSFPPGAELGRGLDVRRSAEGRRRLRRGVAGQRLLALAPGVAVHADLRQGQRSGGNRAAAVNRRAYSYRSASMGSSRAALRAG